MAENDAMRATRVNQNSKVVVELKDAKRLHKAGDSSFWVSHYERHILLGKI